MGGDFAIYHFSLLLPACVLHAPCMFVQKVFRSHKLPLSYRDIALSAIATIANTSGSPNCTTCPIELP